VPVWKINLITPAGQSDYNSDLTIEAWQSRLPFPKHGLCKTSPKIRTSALSAPIFPWGHDSGGKGDQKSDDEKLCARVNAMYLLTKRLFQLKEQKFGFYLECTVHFNLSLRFD
ncbi:hypothetical protein CEXT_680501, partial [Caerostris extrusa]